MPTHEAKFPKGEKMTVDEVAAVVGDSFKEMNENPPESVLEVREEMEGKVASGRKLSWPDGDPTAPWTPWGPAQYGTEVTRGVRSYAGHGGIAVAQGVARKMLSPAALKTALFQNGYFWFEEDVDAQIVLYERPEWLRVLNPSYSHDKVVHSVENSSYFKRYMDMKNSGVQMAPKAKVGDLFTVLKPIQFQGGTNMNPGDKVRVEKLGGQNMVVSFGGQLFRLPVAYYMADDARLALETGKVARQRLTWKLAAEDTQVVPDFSSREAASGLYGFNKATENACESASRKLAKAALRIAKDAFAKDAEVVPFLQAHVKREGSRSAKVLLAAMKEIGPKVASEMRGGRPKEAGEAVYGLYGFKARTADLGLQACTEIRAAAGRIAADLHHRKADSYEKITGFLKQHSREGKSAYAGMLLSCYPDAEMRLASTRSAAPSSVGGWLEWED